MKRSFLCGMLGIALGGCSSPQPPPSRVESSPAPKRAEPADAAPAKSEQKLFVEQVVLGSTHACLRTKDGEVLCWGDNRFGQLGVEDPSRRATPARVPGLPRIMAIAAHARATCAITEHRVVYCWGYRGGLGSMSRVPSNIRGVAKAKTLTMSDNRGCAVVEGGFVNCWGPLSGGERIKASSVIEKIEEVASSDHDLCVRHTDGRVSCDWNGYYNGVPGISGATALSHSLPFGTCAVVEGGKVACWPARKWQDNVKPADAELPHVWADIRGASDIAVGDDHVCIVDSTGDVRCWGNNRHGQLGSGKRSFNFSAKPDRSSGVGLSNVRSIATGDQQTCAVSNGGDAVYCWGKATAGILGPEHSSSHREPQLVAGVEGATSIAVSENSSCALMKDGELACWGMRSMPTVTDSSQSARGVQRFRLNLARMWVSHDRLLGQTSTGAHLSLQAFHSSDPNEERRPAVTMGLPAIKSWHHRSDTEFVLSSTGDLLSYAIPSSLADHEAKPKVVMQGVSEFDVTETTACLVKNGALLCTRPRYRLPTDLRQLKRVPGVPRIKKISIDKGYIAAIRADGRVTTFAPFGDHDSQPRLVAGINDAREVAIGNFGESGCAIQGAGELRCWGPAFAERYTEHGPEVPDGEDLPTTNFGGIQDAQQVRLTTSHACVLHQSGKVSCWGNNAFGQVGAATPSFSATPVRIVVPTTATGKVTVGP